MMVDSASPTDTAAFLCRRLKCQGCFWWGVGVDLRFHFETYSIHNPIPVLKQKES